MERKGDRGRKGEESKEGEREGGRKGGKRSSVKSYYIYTIEILEYSLGVGTVGALRAIVPPSNFSPALQPPQSQASHQ